MTTSDEASGAMPRRRRKKAVNFAMRRTLRFSEAEEALVARKRALIAQQTQRTVEGVSFSEALRRLILDKAGSVAIEARVMDAVSDSVAIEISPRFSEATDGLRNTLSHLQGSVRQIKAKCDAPGTAEALASLAALRGYVDGIEARALYLVEHGTQPSLTIHSALTETESLGYEMEPVVRQLRQHRDSVYAVAKALNVGEDVPWEQVVAAIEETISVRGLIDETERRIVHIAARALPPSSAVQQG